MLTSNREDGICASSAGRDATNDFLILQRETARGGNVIEQRPYIVWFLEVTDMEPRQRKPDFVFQQATNDDWNDPRILTHSDASLKVYPSPLHGRGR